MVLQTRPLTWKEVALRLGEELSSAGPTGYYNFTPDEWLRWALQATNDKAASHTKDPREASQTSHVSRDRN